MRDRPRNEDGRGKTRIAGRDCTQLAAEQGAGRDRGRARQAAGEEGTRTARGAFFPERATSHTKNVTNPNFGYPEFWGTKIAVQRPSDRFRVGCPHSSDSALSGNTRYVNQLYHVISQLCPKIGPLISRCFLTVNKIGLSDSFLSSIATLFRVRLSASCSFACVRKLGVSPVCI